MGNGTDVDGEPFLSIDHTCSQQALAGTANVVAAADPFVPGPDGELLLDPTSVCVDAGDDAAATALGLDWQTMTTAASGIFDAPPVDAGVHYPAPPPITVCGNGEVELGEDCDDGNLQGGDGCEADCSSSDDVVPIWNLQIGPMFSTNCGTGVAFDSAGNLILAAHTAASGPGIGVPEVLWIRKYDTSYVEQWTVEYPAESSSCAAGRIDVDADDNIGFVSDTTGAQTFFGVLDPNGNEVWMHPLADPPYVASAGGSVAFDATGNLLVTGVVSWAAGSGDLWVAKYDTLGVEVWSDTYDGPAGGAQSGRDVAADIAGNVFVSGSTNGLANTQDILVRKYDPNGIVQWTDVIEGAAGTSDFGWAVATSGADALFGGIIRDLPMNGDAWVRRYLADATVDWTTSYTGTGVGNDIAAALAVDSDGTVLVGGAVEDLSGDRTWLARVAADGTVIWERRLNAYGGWLAVAVAGDGRIAVARTASYAYFSVYPP